MSIKDIIWHNRQSEGEFNLVNIANPPLLFQKSLYLFKSLKLVFKKNKNKFEVVVVNSMYVWYCSTEGIITATWPKVSLWNILEEERNGRRRNEYKKAGRFDVGEGFQWTSTARHEIEEESYPLWTWNQKTSHMSRLAMFLIDWRIPKSQNASSPGVCNSVVDAHGQPQTSKTNCALVIDGTGGIDLWQKRAIAHYIYINQSITMKK